MKTDWQLHQHLLWIYSRLSAFDLKLPMKIDIHVSRKWRGEEGRRVGGERRRGEGMVLWLYIMNLYISRFVAVDLFRY